MKKIMMLVAIAAAFASCQSNNKKGAEIVMENDSVVAIIPAPPMVEVDEETAFLIYAGTLDPAEDPQIQAAIAALKAE